MEFKLITTVDDMHELSTSWNRIVDSSSIQVPFLRYEYQRTWWETKGGGEWKNADLAIAAAYQDQNLVGVAPMFFSLNKENEPALLLIGSIEVSDYLDVVIAPENNKTFIHELFDFLDSPEAPPWKVIDWCNLLENSPTLPSLEAAAIKKKWEYRCERLQHSPRILLPGDWEAYLAGIDKKQRHEIRRKIRRLEESGIPTRFYIVEDKSTLRAEGESFMALMAQDAEKEAFLAPSMREFLHSVIQCAFDEHCLQLAFLEIEGKKAAGYLNFYYLDRVWVYNSGLNRQFNEYSPGWVLLAYLVRWAIEHHAKEFDFMRGDEEYKYRFGAIDRFVNRALIRR
jgi:CelD/BcsL family acetyltransferase involved in cellulose biosynthesis